MSVVLPIETDDRFRVLSASPGQTVLAISFPWQDDNDIALLRRTITGEWIQLTTPLHYSLSGAGNPGGGSATLTVPASIGDTFLALGSAVLERLTSIVREGKFSSRNIDDELDRNRIIQQEQSRDIGRAVKVEYGGIEYTLSSDLVDGETLMKDGDRLVAGPDIAALAQDAGTARDQAQAFASNLVSQGTVPIYASVETMSATIVPAGITAVRVNGMYTAGDGGGGLYYRVVGAPDHGASFQSADGAWWELRGINARFHALLLAEVSIQMATGLPVLVACFGDSTEAGYDNTLPPPYIDPLNSPAVAQATCRNVCFNNGIVFENHGVSGTNSTAIILTFKADVEALAARGCKLIVMNTGMNDMQNDPPVSPRRFRMNLLAFEQIARSNGMAIIFKTPNPVWAVPGVGTMDKAERSKNYAQIVREICRATSAILCDIYDLAIRILATGIWTVQKAIPDGVHPSNTYAGIYRAFGREVASVILHPQVGVDGPNQFVAAGGPGTTCFPTEGATNALQTEMGLQVISSNYNGPKTLNMLVRVETTGLDIVLAYPMWIGGIASANVLVDGVGIGSISQYNVGDYGTYFVQQHELTVIKNATPGLHLVQISSAAGAGSIGANYLCTRKSVVSKLYQNNAPFISKSRLLSPLLRMEVNNATTNAITLFREFPISRLNDGIDLEFEAQLAKGEFFVAHGLLAADNFSAAAVCGTAFGLAMSTGNAVIREGEGYAGFLDTVVNLVDNSLQDRSWRVTIPAGLAQPAKFVIDGFAYPTHVLTKPYLGGWLGMQKNGNGIMTIRNLRVLEH